jgi:hypothetical protein
MSSRKNSLKVCFSFNFCDPIGSLFSLQCNYIIVFWFHNPWLTVCIVFFFNGRFFFTQTTILYNYTLCLNYRNSSETILAWRLRLKMSNKVNKAAFNKIIKINSMDRIFCIMLYIIAVLLSLDKSSRFLIL